MRETENMVKDDGVGEIWRWMNRWAADDELGRRRIRKRKKKGTNADHKISEVEDGGRYYYVCTAGRKFALFASCFVWVWIPLRRSFLPSLPLADH